MKEFDLVLPEVRALIAQYLDGHLPFETAARSVAAIYKQTLPADVQQDLEQGPPPKPSQIRLKPISISQWLNPNKVSGPSIRITNITPLSLAPGRSSEDEQKAMKLFREALRLLFGSEGLATFEFGP